MDSRLDQLVLELFDDDTPIDDETEFTQCAGWDSLKHVQLVVALETRFGVDLSADEIAALTCKRAIRNVLTARHVDA
jgi:acyl carrier protein